MAHVNAFRQAATHRLIPSKYRDSSVLGDLGLPSQVVINLNELDAATNERKVSEHGDSPGISPRELLFGVPEAWIVNAAFSHPGPFGGRFNDSNRGAWYAGFELETAVQEVSFHKRRFLRDGRIPGRYPFDYVDFLADFSGSFHALDKQEATTCLLPEPVPACYAPSQALASALLHGGANGIVYPSVRRNGGTCIACFRPALVHSPLKGETYELTIGADSPELNFKVSRELLELAAQADDAQNTPPKRAGRFSRT